MKKKKTKRERMSDIIHNEFFPTPGMYNITESEIEKLINKLYRISNGSNSAKTSVHSKK